MLMMLPPPCRIMIGATCLMPRKTPQVDGHNIIEIGRVHAGNGRDGGRPPGIVHEAVDPAVFSQDSSHQGANIVFDGDVRPHEIDIEPLGQTFPLVTTARRDDHPGLLFGETLDNAFPDAARPAGDNDYLAGNFRHDTLP